MVVFQRTVFYLMIPTHLLCIAWVWLGRILFGVGGWWLLILLVTLVPAMAIAFLVTTILAFTQKVPRTRGRITLGQATVQVTLWAALFGFGFFLVDFGDVADSERSALTQLVGRSPATLETSTTLTMICFWAAAALYVWLLVLLIIGQRNRPRPVTVIGSHGQQPYGESRPPH